MTPYWYCWLLILLTLHSTEISGDELIPVTSVCFDINSMCAAWARSDECVKNPRWMSDNCRVSCRTCPESFPKPDSIPKDLSSGERSEAAPVAVQQQRFTPRNPIDVNANFATTPFVFQGSHNDTLIHVQIIPEPRRPFRPNDRRRFLSTLGPIPNFTPSDPERPLLITQNPRISNFQNPNFQRGTPFAPIGDPRINQDLIRRTEFFTLQPRQNNLFPNTQSAISNQRNFPISTPLPFRGDELPSRNRDLVRINSNIGPPIQNGPFRTSARPFNPEVNRFLEESQNQGPFTTQDPRFFQTHPPENNAQFPFVQPNAGGPISVPQQNARNGPPNTGKPSFQPPQPIMDPNFLPASNPSTQTPDRSFPITSTIFPIGNNNRLEPVENQPTLRPHLQRLVHGPPPIAVNNQFPNRNNQGHHQPNNGPNFERPQPFTNGPRDQFDNSFRPNIINPNPPGIGQRLDGFPNHAPLTPRNRQAELDICQRIRRTAADRAIFELEREHVHVVVEDSSTRQSTLSTKILRDTNFNEKCVPSLRNDGLHCDSNLCFHLRFRTMDGTCNNLDVPVQGAAFTPLRRNLPAIYDDGIGAPLGSIRTLPNARKVSHQLLRSPQNIIAPHLTAMVMQWGQFLSHDIVKTTLNFHSQCTTCDNQQGICFNINVNLFDPKARTFGCEHQNETGQEVCCIKSPRSAPLCNSGRQNSRQQLNENTAFIDGSMIYSSSVPDLTQFKDDTTGALLVEQFEGKTFLPFDKNMCPHPGECQAEFRAGDDRANVFLGLAAMHTIFIREHNRLVAVLKSINPQWSAEKLFQEARKIVGAQIQAITYNEWLPAVLGNQVVDIFVERYEGYKPQEDASISSEFSGAALRFGHGMLPEFFPRVGRNGQPIGAGGVNFVDGLLNSERLLVEGGLDPLIRGIMLTPVKRPQRVSVSASDSLFGNQDLAALNIARGRDQGLSDYNSWRHFCGFGRAKSFADLQKVILSPDVLRNLEQIYEGNIDSIDLYVGALLEDPIVDSLVGPTLACLLGKQFKRLRDGDRFWFENAGIFTPLQLSELRKVTLPTLICLNGDDFDRVPLSSFKSAQLQQFVPCNQTHKLDLNLWRDFPPV